MPIGNTRKKNIKYVRSVEKIRRNAPMAIKQIINPIIKVLAFFC